jgi:hypothetical protein
MCATPSGRPTELINGLQQRLRRSIEKATKDPAEWQQHKHGNEVPSCHNDNLVLTRHSSYQEACQTANERECETTRINHSPHYDYQARIWPRTASTAVDTRRLWSDFTCNSASSHSHSGQSAQSATKRGISTAERHISTTTLIITWPCVRSLTRLWMSCPDCTGTYWKYQSSMAHGISFLRFPRVPGSAPIVPYFDHILS